MTINAELYRQAEIGLQISTATFRSNIQQISGLNEIDSNFIIDDISGKFDEYNKRSSGWHFGIVFNS